MNPTKSLATQFWLFFDSDPLPDVWYADSADEAVRAAHDLTGSVVRVATDDELVALVGPTTYIVLPNGYCVLGGTPESWVKDIYPDALEVRVATPAEALASWKVTRLEQDIQDDAAGY